MSELLPFEEHAGPAMTFNVTEFQQKRTQLREKLVRLALADLRVLGGGPD